MADAFEDVKKFAPFSGPEVEAAFAAMPSPIRPHLLRLRRLVLETAASHPEIGDLEETLKWGEPAYLPKKKRIGTTIRMNAVKSGPDRYALYFPCQTTLIDDFRGVYPDLFRFEGNRAIIFNAGDPITADPLRHCIAMALTYHLKPGKRPELRTRPG